MEDGPLAFDHRHDAGIAEGPGVPGLTTALGVEGGPVEDDRGAALVLAGLQDPGLEVEGVGVVEVDSLGHGLLGSGVAGVRDRAGAGFAFGAAE